MRSLEKSSIPLCIDTSRVMFSCCLCLPGVAPRAHSAAVAGGIERCVPRGWPKHTAQAGAHRGLVGAAVVVEVAPLPRATQLIHNSIHRLRLIAWRRVGWSVTKRRSCG